MKKSLLIAGVTLALSLPLAVQADTKEEFESVYAKAKSTHENAGTYQWTTTRDRLKAAKAAADSGEQDKALAMAREALKLAEESVDQRKQQEEVWRSAAIGN